MNTTPTRMAYDRLTRQQQLSIAVASATDITHRKTEKAEKSPAHLIGKPPPHAFPSEPSSQ
jgi:hypothetical protein